MSFWVSSEDEVLAREVINGFEKIALSDEIEKREELREKVLPKALASWKKWLSEKPIPKPKKVSTESQRLEAYQISRALNISMPNEFVFSDYHLLRQWMTKQKK